MLHMQPYKTHSHDNPHTHIHIHAQAEEELAAHGGPSYEDVLKPGTATDIDEAKKKLHFSPVATKTKTKTIAKKTTTSKSAKLANAKAATKVPAVARAPPPPPEPVATAEDYVLCRAPLQGAYLTLTGRSGLIKHKWLLCYSSL
jgi:hypothetical protein